MYVPKAFELTDPDQVAEVIDANDFGLVVSAGPDGLVATHLPIMLDRQRGRLGTLVAHIARANPHGRLLDGSDAMAVFGGPHGYVSPRWYEASPAVPTWNYVAVHVYGAARVIEEPGRLREIVASLAARYEGPGGWSLDAQPANFIDGMIRGIVGFEIEIARVEGKAKLSQNRPAADRKRVVATLDASERPSDRELAATMRRFAPVG